MVQLNLTFVYIYLVILILFNDVHGEGSDRQISRPTRGFDQMRLAVSRNFGKRAIDMHANKLKSPPDIGWIARKGRGFQEMNLPVARGFGKRGIADFNNFLFDLYALESKIRRLRLAQQNNELQFN